MQVVNACSDLRSPSERWGHLMKKNVSQGFARIKNKENDVSKTWTT